jgi:hypothetical protein
MRNDQVAASPVAGRRDSMDSVRRVIVARIWMLSLGFALWLAAIAAHAETTGEAVPSAFRRAHTSAGSFEVELLQTEAIPLNEVFSLEFRIYEGANPGVAVPGARLTVNTWMPEHQHGGSLQPIVAYHPTGGGRIDGLLFFMEGRWELRIGVMANGQMERVVFDFDLSP